MRIASTLPAQRPPRQRRDRPQAASAPEPSRAGALPRAMALVPVIEPLLLPAGAAAPLLVQWLAYRAAPRALPEDAAAAYARASAGRDTAPRRSLVA